MGRYNNEPKAVIPPKFPLSLFPLAMRPYLELIRFEKLTGTLLTIWPFAWGLTMAAFKIELPLKDYCLEITKSFVAAFIVRSSSATVNDIIDRDLDGSVERTRHRPLPSNRVSVFAATVYLAIQYIIGILFFYHAYSHLALWAALSQLLPMFLIYPFLKRLTYWPQAWVGIAQNFGFVVAWISLVNDVTVSDIQLVIAAMTSCWCWTVMYDTIYSCQDKRDDVKIGVRSTAILFGTWIRPILVGFGLTFLAMLAIAGYLNAQGPAYFLLSIGGTGIHLIWQYRTVDLTSPRSCGENFFRNGQLGWIIWGGLLVDYYLRILRLNSSAPLSRT